MSGIDKSLNNSLEALNAYQQLIKSHVKETTPQTKQKLLTGLMNNLIDTQTELSKEITNNRVVRINTNLLKAVEQAIGKLIVDEPTEDKVNAVHFVLYGTNVPFWNVLREIQNLLFTIEGLKEGRGKRVSKVRKFSKKKKK